MKPSILRWCFDTGQHEKVLAWPEPSQPADPGFGELHEYVTRVLVEQGKFEEAERHAGKAASRMPKDSGERCCIQLLATFLQLSRAPDAWLLDKFHQLVFTLAQLGKPCWEAQSHRWAARLILYEVSVQGRSLKDIDGALDLCRQATALLRYAKRPLDALAESVWVAERWSSLRRPSVSQMMGEWQAILELATALGWQPTVARCHLAMADFVLEHHLSRAEPVDEAFVHACHQPSILEYEKAQIVAPMARVLANRGRILQRFGHSQAPADLRQAASEFEDVGRFAMADVLWRELSEWYENRGCLDELRDIDERLESRNSQHDRVSAGVASVRVAHRAFSAGNLAVTSEAAQAPAGALLFPGPTALLLMQQTQAALGRNDRTAGLMFAKQAVNLLTPSAPCPSLGEALAMLAKTELDPQVVCELMIQASDADLAADNPVHAARRLIDLAELLATLPFAPVEGDASQKAMEAMQRAMQIIGDDRSCAAVELHGRILQARGIWACRNGDLAGAQSLLMQATKIFHACGRNMNAAFASSQRALVTLACARANLSPAVFVAAADLMLTAQELFRRQGLLGEEFRLTRLAGSIYREGAGYGSPDLRWTMYEAAAQLFEEAADMALRLRLGRRDIDLLYRQANQEDFSNSIQHFLEEGFLFATFLRDDPSQSWIWLQRMKAQGLLLRLSDGSCHLPTPESAPPDLQAEEQQLIRQRDQVPRNTPSSRVQWHKLTSQLEKTWQKMSKVPGTSVYAALRRGLPVSWSDWRTAMREKAGSNVPDSRPLVAMHYYWPSTHKGDLMVLIERSDSPEIHVRHLPNLREPIESFLAMAFPPGQRSAVRQSIELYGGDEAWAEFFHGLIEPLRSLTRKDDTLLIFPHGPLHAMPFHALRIDGTPLGERNPVCTAPNPTIMMHGWERQSAEYSSDTQPKSLILVPDYRRTRLGDLPHAMAEASHVGNLLGAHPSQGDEMERDVLIKLFSAAKYIHFVGHASEFPSGWDSGLELGGTWRLTALDIVHQSLRARLVTLSGCRTSRHRGSVGDEIVGLVPSMLQAGASAVLASNWEVRDEAGGRFMKEFYNHLLGSPSCTLAAAFQAAIREVRKSLPSLADWAAFTLHGNWQ